MSIYSGFATRQQETSYCKQLVNLIKILQRRILKFYRNETTDEEAFKSVFQQVIFHLKILKTYIKINQMEQNKYIEPFFSSYLADLINYLISDTKAIKLSSIQNYSEKCTCFCHINLNELKNNQEDIFLTKANMITNKKELKYISRPLPISTALTPSIDQTSNDIKTKARSVSSNHHRSDFVPIFIKQRLKFPLKEYYSSRREPKQFILNLSKMRQRNSQSPNQSTLIKQPIVKSRSPYNRTSYSLNFNGKKQKYNFVSSLKSTSRPMTTIPQNQDKRIRGSIDTKKQIEIATMEPQDDTSALENISMVKCQSLYDPKTKQDAGRNFDNPNESQNASLDVQKNE